jgi:hypothetical protein
MGFVGTEYNKLVNTASNLGLNLQENPYYMYSDKKPTEVTYWNINTKKSTLDLGSRTNYDQLGKNSPLRYNKILGFYLYGLPQFPVDMNRGEYGVESSTIGGEAFVLPNTLIPNVDDYFTINYLTKPYLFRVTKSSINSLETKVNGYRIEFVLDNSREDYIQALNTYQKVRTLRFKIQNVGSNAVSCFISEDDEKNINALMNLYNHLKECYCNLYYRNNVQTFILHYLEMFIYDPYLTEFMIRNKLFSYGENYLFMQQAVHKPPTFAIEYKQSIFYDLEERNKHLHTNSCYPVPVHDPNSFLMYRMENYVELSINVHHSMKEPIMWISGKLFGSIEENTEYEDDGKNYDIPKNIIIRYFNDGSNFSITNDEIHRLKDYDWRYTKDNFYEIPMLMYIIKTYIHGLESKVNEDEDLGEDSGIIKEECYSIGK